MHKNEFTFDAQTICYHSSWERFLTPAVYSVLEQISSVIGNDYTPATQKVFRFFAIDPARIKYIIIGQDPYPQPGIATGRAFEVNGFRDWTAPLPNGSLRNILKLLHQNQRQREKPASIEEIREDILSNRFKILPPSELFAAWENQGVLLLNTALTCRLNAPNSHAELWLPFTQQLIVYLKQNYPSIIWLLWGKSAWQLCESIPVDRKLNSFHPRLNGNAPGSFFAENHFKRLADINWNGM
jgi:uracil-DNA glycosylase